MVDIILEVRDGRIVDVNLKKRFDQDVLYSNEENREFLLKLVDILRPLILKSRHMDLWFVKTKLESIVNIFLSERLK